VLGPERSRQDSLLRAIVGQQRTSGGRILFEGAPTQRIALSPRPRRHRLRAAGREISRSSPSARNLETGYAPLEARRPARPRRGVRALSGAEVDARRRGGDLSAVSSSSSRSAARL